MLMTALIMIAGAASGVLSSKNKTKSYNKSLLNAYKKQTQALVQSYNYNQNQLDMQERSVYESASSALQNLTLAAMQSNAAITAGLNEAGYDGRNYDKIKRTAEGQALNQRTAIIENEAIDVMNIRSQKDALYMQTQNELDNLRDSTKGNIIGKTQALINAIGAGIQGAQLGLAAGSAGSAASSATAQTAGTSTAATWSGRFTENFSNNWNQYRGMFNALGSFNTGVSLYSNSRGL